MACCMSAMSAAYTKRLASRVELRGDKLELYTHTLPTGRPGGEPCEVFGVGEVRVEVPKGYSLKERDECLRRGNGKTRG